MPDATQCRGLCSRRQAREAPTGQTVTDDVEMDMSDDSSDEEPEPYKPPAPAAADAAPEPAAKPEEPEPEPEPEVVKIRAYDPKLKIGAPAVQGGA